MSDIEAVRDLAIIGIVGYVGYKFFSKSGVVEKAKETIYTTGVEHGRALGSLQSELQKQWGLFVGEFKRPETLLNEQRTKSVMSPIMTPIYKSGYEMGKTIGSIQQKLKIQGILLAQRFKSLWG